MVAPGSRAALASVTVPVIEPVSTCATAADAGRSIKETTARARRRIRMLPPRDGPGWLRASYHYTSGGNVVSARSRSFDAAPSACDPHRWIMASESARTYPSELPVVALRQTVAFPLTLQPLAINRPLSIEAVNRGLAGDRLLFLTLQNTDDDQPRPDDLRRVGTI